MTNEYRQALCADPALASRGLNDAFNGWDRDAERWSCAMVDALTGVPACLFVVCPDIVREACPAVVLLRARMPELIDAVKRFCARSGRITLSTKRYGAEATLYHAGVIDGPPRKRAPNQSELRAREWASVPPTLAHREPLMPVRTSWSEELDPRNVRAVDTIGGSDAVVFGSPVYRASLPGVLKNLLDHLSVDSLRHNPVALIVVGARPHHYLAVDRHMRDILSWFGALTLPSSVYLTHDDFDDGRLRPEAEAALHELAGSLLLFSKRVANAEFGPAPLAAAEVK